MVLQQQVKKRANTIDEKALVEIYIKEMEEETKRQALQAEVTTAIINAQIEIIRLSMEHDYEIPDMILGVPDEIHKAT